MLGIYNISEKKSLQIQQILYGVWKSLSAKMNQIHSFRMIQLH